MSRKKKTKYRKKRPMLEGLINAKKYWDDPHYFNIDDYHNDSLPSKPSKNRILRKLQDLKAVFDPM